MKNDYDLFLSDEDLSKSSIDTKIASAQNENPVKIRRDENMIQCIFINDKNQEEKILADIDLTKKTTNIYPTNTIEASQFFFEPKYSNINFVFEGFDVEVNETTDDAFIYGLPDAFIKTIKFGLGLLKKYNIIITTILKYFGDCKTILISTTKQTTIENYTLIINDNDFNQLCNGIDRNQNFYLKEASEAKEFFIYDNLLSDINPQKYPELRRKPKKDLIYKILKKTDFTKISQTDKNILSNLKDNTDLGYLTVLTAEFERKLSENHQESTYQSFFEENPLLLTMFAGSPYVQFKNQAYVGGKSFNNKNGQYPDFLQKHKITNNTFIIEIKTPQTPLLEKNPYRKTGIYAASKDLSGSISQLITQKYQLETEIATLIKNADDRDVEAYNVQGLIIIGILSSLEEKEMKRSFELYRNNQKNLRIVTYDECLEQLKSFVDLLSKNIKTTDENQ